MQRAIFAHNVSKTEKILSGVWRCMGANDAVHDWYEYATVRSIALKRHKKEFINAEKSCEEAGEDFMEGLVRVCTIMHDLDEMRKGFSEENSRLANTIVEQVLTYYLQQVQAEEAYEWLATHKALTPSSIRKMCGSLHDVVAQSLARIKARKEND